jgi:hypothetical protein
MAALVLTRLVQQALRVLPAPVHRALDAWAQRAALKRREKRMRLLRRAFEPK